MCVLYYIYVHSREEELIGSTIEVVFIRRLFDFYLIFIYLNLIFI